MATASTASHYVSLAKTLPPKLQTFFARYPPTRILDPLPKGGFPRTGYQTDRPNPFLPKKHSKTGRTHDPVYSLRRQADLVKLARDHGVEELLPYTPKKTEEQLKHRVKYGLRVKGTGVDQKVKGKIYERQQAVKYVLEAVLLLGKDVAGRARYADTMLQDGEEERSHAQDASAYQGVESGKFDRLCFTWFQSYTDDLGRLDARTGPGGPNKRWHGLYESLHDVQIYIPNIKTGERLPWPEIINDVHDKSQVPYCLYCASD